MAALQARGGLLVSQWEDFIVYCKTMQKRLSLFSQPLSAGHFCVMQVVKPASEELRTLTGPLVGQQLVAFLAAALETAHRVSTHMITSAVVEAALVDIC